MVEFYCRLKFDINTVGYLLLLVFDLFIKIGMGKTNLDKSQLLNTMISVALSGKTWYVTNILTTACHTPGCASWK